MKMLCILQCVLGLPKTMPGVDDPLGGLACGHTHDAKGKEHRTKSRGNQVQASQSPLPVESQSRRCLTPPTIACGSRCEMSTKEAC